VGNVNTTVAPTGADYTSVFYGDGAAASLGTSNGRIVVKGSAGTAFYMSVGAFLCCEAHDFTFGPWSGTWTLDSGNGDAVSGTADGVIDAACNAPLPGPAARCSGVPTIGPGVSFKLTITGGTGRYAGASGTGSFNGDQTPQVANLGPIPPAVFEGRLDLSAT
jgi:hypothetical protein